VVRSKVLVEYLLGRPGRLVEGPSSLTWLYTDVAVHGVKIGLEDSSKSAWSRATQEQRNWSIGFIIDRLVVPYWAGGNCLKECLGGSKGQSSRLLPYKPSWQKAWREIQSTMR